MNLSLPRLAPTRTRRTLSGASAALLMAAAVVTLTTGSASANLPGSLFEGGDGNMVVNTSGNLDWANVPNLAPPGIDIASKTADNAFGQGTKEDDPNVTIVDGSIPPNKNNLTRFYEASQQTSSGDVYLQLAWERAVNIGNANLDFEVNQKATAGFTTTRTGAITLNRNAGDILVSYDFGGSGTPTISISTWLTAAAGNTAGQCFSTNALPCWGLHTALNGSQAEAQVNSGTITESLAGGTLATGLFGEASINLTAAGVIPKGTCKAFGSVFVKSRSSSSFGAELKDFIAPIAVNINSCSSITIGKVTENAPTSAPTFGFSSTGGLTPATFSLNGGDSTTYSGLSAGTYTVTEGTEPTGWDLKSLSCTDGTANYSGAAYSGATATITLPLGQDVTCTYTNHFTNSPGITTTLHPATVDVGGAVYDSAALSGASATAGGTVTYTVWTNATCTVPFVTDATATPTNSVGTKAVTNGVVPDSNSFTYTAAGSYYYKASYSGDANNNATSDCNEPLTVQKKSPTAATAQDLIPNDTFTLSGGYSATGTVSFYLYAPGDTTCTTPVYSESGVNAVTLSATGTAATSNSTYHATSEGTYRWKAHYSGDTNNNPADSACGVENFTITNH